MDPATVLPSVSARTHFRLALLGPFMVERDGEVLDIRGLQRQAAMFFRLLAISPGHRRHREDLIALLWPEATVEAGASNLRRVVHLLRRGFEEREPSPILSERGWIALNPAFGWEIDLERFEALARSRDLADLLEAAALYRGEPLPDDRYDDWATPAREHVAQLWRDLCLHLAERYRESGGPEQAIPWLHRLLAGDPLDEEPVRQLLHDLMAIGRDTDALRVYREFERRLRDELDVEPAPETRDIVAHLAARRQPEPRPASPLPGSAPVVSSYPLSVNGHLAGRQAELAGLISGLDGADPISLVLLKGEAGMGKTRLLAEVSRKAMDAGALVLAGGSYEGEGRLPYGPIHDALLDYMDAQPEDFLLELLGDLLPELIRIVPEMRRLDTARASSATQAVSERLQLFSAVAETLARISRDRPLVLLLDDLHWADDATLQLLHFLLRQPVKGGRVFLVAACRVEEVVAGSSLAQLVASLQEGASLAGRGLLMEVAPLEPGDLAVLAVDQLSGRCSDHLAALLHGRSGGNPLFAQQMIRLLRQQERLQQADDGWALSVSASLDLPPAVRETMARRLRHLLPVQREVLVLAAVLGREFSFPLLEAVWDRGEAQLFAALDAAVDASILDETETGYAFRHPLLREVVYDLAPKHRRPLLHGRAGLALETLSVRSPDVYAAELASHFGVARHIHPERAVRYSLLAGDVAEEAFAHREAEGYYGTAAEIAAEIGDVAAEMEGLAKRGNTLRTQGRYDEAVVCLEKAVQMYRAAGDIAGAAHAAAGIGYAYAARNTPEAGLERVNAALVDEPRLPVDALAALYLVCSRLHFVAGDFRSSEEAATRAADLARQAGDRAAFAAAEMRRGTALALLADWNAAYSVLRDSVLLADELGELRILSDGLTNLAGVCASLGRLAECASYCRRAVEIAERRGDPSDFAFRLAALGNLQLYLGEWVQARTYLEESVSIGKTLGSARVSMVAQEILGTLEMREGHWEAMRERLDEAVAMAESSHYTRVLLSAGSTRAQGEILQGRPCAAVALLEPLDGPDAAESEDGTDVLVTLAWAHVELGNTDQAEGIIARTQQSQTVRCNKVKREPALLVEAMIRAAQVRNGEAERCLAELLGLARTLQTPWEEAQGLYELGRLHAAEGRHSEAREHLERAGEIFQRLGARPYVQRTQDALAALSARLRSGLELSRDEAV